MVGIRANSNLIPSKKIQTQIFCHSESFRVIPSHSERNPSKKKSLLSPFLPHSYHIPTSFRPHSYHIPTSFRPHSYLIPTSFLPHSDHIPTTFQPHSDLIPTSFLPHSYHIPTTFRPHSDLIPTTFLPYIPVFGVVVCLCNFLGLQVLLLLY